MADDETRVRERREAMVRIGRQELCDILEQYWWGSPLKRVNPDAIKCLSASDERAMLVYGPLALYVCNGEAVRENLVWHLECEGVKTRKPYFHTGFWYVIAENMGPLCEF